MKQRESPTPWLAAAWCGCALIAGSIETHAEDWPNWRGPAFDGVSAEALPDPLPEDPVIRWKTNVGTGFSTVSVARGRVFTMGNRDETDTVWCLDADSGEVLWQHSYPCELDPRFYEGGPSATPTVHDDSVFTLSKKGHAFRLDFESGKVIWSRDLVADHGFELPEWSFAGSPFVFEGRLIVLNVGAAGAALDYHTGKTIWKSSPEISGYSTAAPFPRDGKMELAMFVAKKAIGLDPATGKVTWRFASECSRYVNAADAVVSGNRLMISSSSGAVCLEIGEGDRPEPAVIWETKNLRTYFNPTVLVGDYLYAIHGTTHRPTELVCLDWKTGETLWSEPGFGSGALMAARDRLILFDKGQLTIFAADPAKFDPLLQLQVLTGKCWTVPVLAQGRIYCRNAEGDLACVDLAVLNH